MLVEDSSLVLSLAQLFQSDWDRVPSPAIDLPLVISPINSRGTLLDLIQTAHHSLEVYVLSLEETTLLQSRSRQRPSGECASGW